MAVSGLKLKTLPAITVTTAGTRVPLSASSVLVYAASIQSIPDNTGTQYLGDETVASTNGIEVMPGDIVEIDAPAGARGVDQFDLSKMYVDSSENSAEFRIVAWIRE